jgi:2,4-dienoyl-CoA reductase-like NADH-dependent reductase (Old Yellow Enzyme family)/thioredoxin reductase
MSDIKYPNLFTPIKLGDTIFRNRIIASPTGFHDLTPEYFPTREAYAYYERKAMGGAAAVTVGDCAVDTKRGMFNIDHIPLDTEKHLASMSNLSDAISRHGAVASIELQHAGMYARGSAQLGNQIYGPCDWVDPQGNRVLAMTEEIIEETIEAFANAAAWAKRCGFGMVTIHGGHGWLLSQFMSPLINKRKDRWGGSIENRMRLTLAVVERIRKKCGRGFPIEIRISGDECNPDGYTIEEGIEIAKCLDGKVDLIHVSAGNHEVRDAFVITHPSMFLEDGCNVKYAAMIKKHIKTPVATVGALSDPEHMEEIIASGQADIVEVARGLLADPDLPNKARTGREDEIIKCMRCLSCFTSLMARKQFLCVFNPVIGRELENKFDAQPAQKKTVLVAGGGIGGMQAALTAAERGHKVILIEKTGRLGGVLKCEEKVPFKKNLRDYLTRQERMLKKTGVDVRLNTQVTPEVVKSIGPDVVIAALGSRPIVPNIKGIDRENVYGAEEAYINPELVGKSVIILGGGLVGTELAIFLAGLGRRVTIMEMEAELNNGGNFLHGIAIDIQIRELGIKTALSTKAVEINEKGVLGQGPEGERLYEADTVIYAVGQEPLSEEAIALSGCAQEFHMIGDCLKPANIHKATSDAFYIAGGIGRK